MADKPFTQTFKKSVLDHGTLMLSQWHKEQKKKTSFSVTMSGAGVHFVQWTLDGGAPLKARFDLLSVNMVDVFLKKAVASKDPVAFAIECDYKPKDQDKFHENTLVIRKDDRGIVRIGIAKPGVDINQAESFPVMPSYFLRFKQDDNEISKQEINAHFASRFAATLISMAQTVGVTDYVQPVKDNQGGGGQSNNNYGGNRQSGGGNNQQQSHQQPAQQPNNNFDNEFDEDF